jgi:hypothetical protein
MIYCLTNYYTIVTPLEGASISLPARSDYKQQINKPMCGCGPAAMTGASQQPFAGKNLTKRREIASNPGSIPGSRTNEISFFFFTTCYS